MEPLINKTYVEALFQLSSGVSDTDFEKYIIQAQKFQLRKLMPGKFLFDLIKNSEAENYQAVLNSGEYTYEGYTYYHEGLKTVIAYYAYALYVFQANNKSTSFGLVVKHSGQSEPVHYNERRDWYNEFKAQAGQLWEDVKMFIERNEDNYPVWAECCTRQSTPGGFKTKLIQ
jgi:hypothetical protein